jgi:hypothetical protein
MNKSNIAIAVAGILAAGTLAVAPMAAAAPTGGSNAADTVKTLRDMGYNVQLNGTPTLTSPARRAMTSAEQGTR